MKKRKNNIISIFDIYLSKFLITALVTIILLICFKKNSMFREKFYDVVLSDNFDFAYVDSLYKKYLGGVLPFSSIVPKTEPVFSEDLLYTSKSDYFDGVDLSVDGDYSVPAMSDGIVIFIGNKDNYNNTVIVEDKNGVDTWYGNISNVNVSLYDYIDKGTVIGISREHLYLVFKKDANVLNYEDFI